MAGKCGTILSMGEEPEVKGEAEELLGSGRGGMETPRNGYPMALPLGWSCHPEPHCPAGIKDTGTNPAFTRAGALGEQMRPCSFTECPKPLFPSAGKVI